MQPYALVVGESLVDVVLEPDGSRTERPGGSAANVAVALARLGRPVRFATAFADDERGRAIASHLARDGVELATDAYAVARTSSAEATIAADGSASYVFDLEWRLNPLGEELPLFVHVCSIGAVLEPGADDVLAILDRIEGATVSYDINARPAITGTGPELVARVERVVAAAHLVKASDEDLAALYPALTLGQAVQHLLELGPRAVAVTLGGEGATWRDADGVVEVTAPEVDVADTIGAGDTFSAAMIDALWERPDRAPAEVLAHAVRAAAVTVSRPGADPPYHRELVE
ncbi:carbohydrate kinase [Nocardioides sp. 503]|uniref:carbohydrate kinase family protein n=1 Tax=Nocardioides sp. 503 TaxID=2508326 RepID=UPI00106FCD67|nr:carbohydrate kinase [Nocardioides sp. 503]